MEGYLANCIESVLRTPSLAPLEIIVVNDGSKDRTSRIAHEYASQFIDTVRVIDKPNGNYGSTINAALPEVRGEYVKILDADDSFEGSRVAEMLDFLRKMRGVDMVVTPFTEVVGNKERRVEYNIYSRKPYEYGKQYNAEDIFADGAIRFFMMHGVCYRTEVLRSINYRQSEGISYTDQEWVFYPLFKVQTIAFADIPLYRYNLSREGQTMDAKVQMRSLAQLVAVTEALGQYFASRSRYMPSDSRMAFLRNVVADRMRIVYRKYLLAMDSESFANSYFVMVDARLAQLAQQCKIESLPVPVNNLFKVDLLDHWQKQGRRHSDITRWFLRTLDGIMVKVHSLIFK
jgi:glycosyltransferase involved in cell wall biosynthesis